MGPAGGVSPRLPMTMSALPRPLLRILATAFVFLMTIAVPVAPPAGASTHDQRARQRELQQKKAEKASEVNVLRASDAEVERALAALNEQGRAESARAAAARQAADAAARQAAEARAEEERVEAKLAELRQAMKKIAVDAYVRGPSKELGVALKASSLQEVATRQHFLDITAAKAGDTADQLRAAVEDLEVRRAAAEEAERTAQARRRTVEERLSDVKSAVAVKERVAVSVEARLERALGEAASLEALDRQLAADIKARQARLAALVGSRPPSAPRASRAATRGGSISLTTVRGITVATEIAPNLERLLEAADADGLSLSGGGYRSSEQQVAARRANCGTSDYDIYEKPASQCSPPTARPGQSMHEQGLAIDFTNNGRLIQSRSNPAFGWLSRNASRFGLYNLPAEPWHWSTNGN